MSLELLKSKTGRTLIESHRGIEADVLKLACIKLGELGEAVGSMSVSEIALFLRHNYQRWRWVVSYLGELKNSGLAAFPLLEDVLVWAREVGVTLSLDVKSFRPKAV
jgi:hypothetical protein